MLLRNAQAGLAPWHAVGMRTLTLSPLCMPGLERRQIRKATVLQYRAKTFGRKTSVRTDTHLARLGEHIAECREYLPGIIEHLQPGCDDPVKLEPADCHFAQGSRFGTTSQTEIDFIQIRHLAQGRIAIPSPPQVNVITLIAGIHFLSSIPPAI
ncbi:hypothetical protein CY652_10055 [Burkholderia sp. WAC0059]|nr:hypothetical protein CY652_10055 [Burkholderia sp. WAC0059]